MTVEFSSTVSFDTASGGTVHMLSTAEVERIGIENGFAQYDDLGVDAHVDTSLDIGRDDSDVTGSVKHVAGDTVFEFHIVSQQPNGRADLRLHGLQPEAWFRLEFNGVLAATAAGRAHGQASLDGVLQFNGVKLPN